MLGAVEWLRHNITVFVCATFQWICFQIIRERRKADQRRTWSIVSVGSSEAYWVWASLKHTDCGLLWSILSVGSSEAYWVWASLKHTDCGLLWSILSVGFSEAYWLWAPLKHTECGLLWNILSVGSSEAYWLWAPLNHRCGHLWRHKQQFPSEPAGHLPDLTLS